MLEPLESPTSSCGEKAPLVTNGTWCLAPSLLIIIYNNVFAMCDFSFHGGCSQAQDWNLVRNANVKICYSQALF